MLLFAEEAADHVSNGAEPTLAFQARLFFALVELLFEFQFQSVFLHGLTSSR